MSSFTVLSENEKFGMPDALVLPTSTASSTGAVAPPANNHPKNYSVAAQIPREVDVAQCAAIRAESLRARFSSPTLGSRVRTLRRSNHISKLLASSTAVIYPAMSTLPPELEIQIFESVVKASPNDAVLRLCLMLVARRVKIWVEPFIYHCLIFSRANNWDRLKRIVATKPRDFLAKHVKSICMPLSTVNMQEAEEILLACPGVERLACWIDHRATAETFAIIPPSIPIQPFALRRLSMELSHFLSLPAHLGNTQARLTHLELVYWEDHAEYYPQTLDLGRFAHLTHLALRSDSMRFQWPVPMAIGMVATCRGLKVLVLLDNEVGRSESVRRALNDRRAVAVISEDALHDWEPTAKSFHEWEVRLGRGMDMWARGEDIIRRNM